MLIAQMKFTEARNQFTDVIDRVQNFAPIAVQPRKKSEKHTILLKQDLVLDLLAAYKFELELLDDTDSSYSYWLQTFDLYGYGETKEEALDSLVDDVILYVHQYIEHPVRYVNAPNRRQHFPYVLKISLCENQEEVKQMLLEHATKI